VGDPFSHDRDYLGRPEQQAMVNYRVRDLDAMLAQLRAAGVAVEERIEELEFGRSGGRSIRKETASSSGRRRPRGATSSAAPRPSRAA